MSHLKVLAGRRLRTVALLVAVLALGLAGAGLAYASQIGVITAGDPGAPLAEPALP
jgi:hypothetical protein